LSEESPPKNQAPVGEELEREKSLEHEETTPRDDGVEIVDPSDSEVLEAAIIAAQFSGPLPPPEILRAYDDVVEGGANRIFDQWERETLHRQSLEQKVLDAYVSGFSRAQWMAFVVILVIGVGGLVIVALGHPLVGFAGFFLALAAVAASFFRERTQRDASADLLSEDEEDSG
jgi:uncharacterized membrane protein